MPKRLATLESVRAIKSDLARLRRSLRNIESTGTGKRVRKKKRRQHPTVHWVKPDADIPAAVYGAGGSVSMSEGQAIVYDRTVSDKNVYDAIRPSGGVCEKIDIANPWCTILYAKTFVKVSRQRPCEPFMVEQRPCMIYLGTYVSGNTWTINTPDGTRNITAITTETELAAGDVRTLMQSCGCEWVAQCEEV